MSTKLDTLLAQMTAHQRTRYEICVTESMSPYRRIDCAQWILAGAVTFRVVDSLTRFRGSPRADRATCLGQHVICRPSSGGQWGKNVVYRVSAWKC